MTADGDTIRHDMKTGRISCPFSLSGAHRDRLAFFRVRPEPDDECGDGKRQAAVQHDVVCGQHDALTGGELVNDASCGFDIHAGVDEVAETGSRCVDQYRTLFVFVIGLVSLCGIGW